MSIECKYCGGKHLNCYGFSCSGKQRMKCNDCSRTFTIKGLNVGGNPYSQEKRQRVLDLLKAGLSFRKIAKKENIDIKTISIWHFMHEMGR